MTSISPVDTVCRDTVVHYFTILYSTAACVTSRAPSAASETSVCDNDVQCQKGLLRDAAFGNQCVFKDASRRQNGTGLL